MLEDRINRPEYMQKLIEFKDKSVVKIITGIRRCGKSTLLDLFEDYLLEQNVPAQNIQHMNMESMKYRDLLNEDAFYDYVSQRIVENEKNYLIFDELQAVSNWEKAIESFRLDYDVDIYITGSNAYLLSSEFSTLLAGRYVEIRLLPLSFKEFLTFYTFAPDVTLDDKFQRYLQIGGMPILRQFDFNIARINETLEGIYSTVILRDVLERNNATDQVLLHKLVMFLADNIGCITSPNSIGNVLTDEGDIERSRGKSKNSVATKTVNKYIAMLKNAFVFYSVGRFDIKGKQYLKTLGKNYIIDLGIRNMLLGYRDADRGHILENVVYLELIRRGYTVSIGKVGETEVDFIAETQDEKIYIQVAETMASEEVRERELRSLRLISDNYDKMVLSMDKSYIKSYEGIKSINVLDFLLNK
ncbi:ATP-binding protein [Christensenellaceae bacterium OttesenSCG-928-K19]|nr:ATP-binding protein [Christensenellaceae bacterium OttesenSCG-928-K19]